MGADDLNTVFRNNPELIRYEDLEPWAKTIYQQAKKNALRRGIAFPLSQQEFAFLIFESSMRCSVSGIPFDLESQTSGSYERRPFYPSMDRCDSSKGYEYGNVRLVCVAVNLAMNTWGEQVFLLVARAAVAFQDSGEAVPMARRRGRKRLEGVVFYAKKRLGAQYGAVIRWEDGGRYVIGWHGTELEAYTHRLRALREIECGTPLSLIGYCTILSGPKDEAKKKAGGMKRKLASALHNTSACVGQEFEIKGKFTAEIGLPDRDRT